MHRRILWMTTARFRRQARATIGDGCQVLLVALAVFLGSPAVVLAARVQALFNITEPTASPFPSDVFTVPDHSHNTRLRVKLPFPDCPVRPSDCNDLHVINTLDGFNLQPRLSLPFTGAIDLDTVTSDTVFLVKLGRSRKSHDDNDGRVIGINQVVWDPDTNTLYAESDALLEQHTRYILIVTRGVRDLEGHPVQAAPAFKRFRNLLHFGQTKDPALQAYRIGLWLGLIIARQAGVQPDDVVAASIFTTQSTTAVLEKIRGQLQAETPEPADFLLGPGSTRTVFARSEVTGIVFDQQVRANPPSFAAVPLFLGALPEDGPVGILAFGKYDSPDYQTSEKFIPPVGTRSGVPGIQRTNEVFFNLFLPSGPTPSAGWPVVIYGHGGTTGKHFDPFLVANSLAARGLATIAINVVGHGGGTAGTLTVSTHSGAVTFPAGGRGIDLNNNGTITSQEGLNAVPPYDIILGRDGLRQTVVDLMQLVRVIEAGVDIHGDGVPDLDPSRIYYTGLSLGGIYGTVFLAVEPRVRAGVLIVPGGPLSEVGRLGSFRSGASLAARVPSLINVGGTQFNENMPLRNQPPVINTVPGAIAIQQLFEHREWVSGASDPVAYAVHLQKQPLDGVLPKPLIVQFAKGDKTNPNPTTTAMLRAGDLAEQATLYRHDLAFAANPAVVPKDPHIFLYFNYPVLFSPLVSGIALDAQAQMAAFLASDGTLVIDPDGPLPLFEVPIVPPLPEDLDFIP